MQPWSTEAPIFLLVVRQDLKKGFWSKNEHLTCGEKKMPNTIRIPPALKMPSSVEGVALRFLEKREEMLKRASQSWPFWDLAERQAVAIAFKRSGRKAVTPRSSCRPWAVIRNIALWFPVSPHPHIGAKAELSQLCNFNLSDAGALMKLSEYFRSCSGSVRWNCLDYILFS